MIVPWRKFPLPPLFPLGSPMLVGRRQLKSCLIPHRASTPWLFFFFFFFFFLYMLLKRVDTGKMMSDFESVRPLANSAFEINVFKAAISSRTHFSPLLLNLHAFPLLHVAYIEFGTSFISRRSACYVLRYPAASEQGSNTRNKASGLKKKEGSHFCNVCIPQYEIVHRILSRLLKRE